MVRRRSGIALRDTSRVYFTLHDAVLLELVFVGSVSRLAVENARDTPAFVRRDTLLLDCEAMTEFEPDARPPTIHLLRYLRALGIQRLACVAPFSSQRVTMAALAFVAELDLELFGDRARALRACT
jgi:hypothetical protein